MIEIGDLVAFDDPYNGTTKYGIAVWVGDIGGRVVKVDFGNYKLTIFDDMKLRRVGND